MKIIQLTSLSILAFLFACGGDQAQEASSEVQEEVQNVVSDIRNMALNSEAQIEDWIAEVIASTSGAQQFPESPTKEISVGGKTWQASVLNPDGPISVVRAAHPGWSNPDQVLRYLTRDGKVVLFENFSKADDQYVVDKIYYNEDGELLSSSTRTGSTIQEARSAVPGEFKPEEGDTYDDYNQIRQTAESVLNLFAEEG